MDGSASAPETVFLSEAALGQAASRVGPVERDPSAVPRTYLQRLTRKAMRKIARPAAWVTGTAAVLILASAGLPFAASLSTTTPVPVPPARPPQVLPLVAPPAAPEELTPASASAVAYRIEVALFESAARAVRLADQLSADGFPAYSEERELRGGRVGQHVLIGPYADRAEAEMAVAQLQPTAGYADARVVETAAPSRIEER